VTLKEQLTSNMKILLEATALLICLWSSSMLGNDALLFEC